MGHCELTVVKMTAPFSTGTTGVCLVQSTSYSAYVSLCFSSNSFTQVFQKPVSSLWGHGTGEQGHQTPMVSQSAIFAMVMRIIRTLIDTSVSHVQGECCSNAVSSSVWLYTHRYPFHMYRESDAATHCFFLCAILSTLINTSISHVQGEWCSNALFLPLCDSFYTHRHIHFTVQGEWCINTPLTHPFHMYRLMQQCIVSSSVWLFFSEASCQLLLLYD